MPTSPFFVWRYLYTRPPPITVPFLFLHHPHSKYLMPSLFIHDHTAHSATPSCVPTTIQKHLDVYRQRNRLLPILRIYPDLLEYIFLLGVSLEDTIQRRQRAIFSYSQTCHDWRIVAISVRSLWAALVDFEENSEAWNNELLRRSRPCPIVVRSMADSLRDSSVISAELAHLERIRIYQIGFDISAWDILLECLQQPAPHIEYLNLNFINSPIDTFILPSTLFAGHAPRLRRLEMARCLVDFKAPALRALTTLSMGYLCASIAPTPLEWLQYLSHLPSLTSLHLVHSMRSLGHYTLETTDQVKLPLLAALKLEADLHDIHIFISRLNFPVNCELIIRCAECYPGPELDTVLLAYLHRLNYAHHLQPENCPFLIYAQRSRLFMWNDSSDDSDSHIALLEQPPMLFLDLYLNLNFGFEIWESLLTPVLQILGEAFSNFTSLDLQLPTTHPALLPCLCRATRLTQLTNVSVVMTKKLLSELQIIQPLQFIPLPALHTIIFTDDDSMWGAPYQAFLSFLTWRRNIGYPITRVLFRQCLVLDDTVMSLGLLGVQVDCDPEGSRWQRL